MKRGKRTRTEKTPWLTLALLRRMERTPSAPGCASITTEGHGAVPASVTIPPFGATVGVTVRVGTAVASAPAVVETVAATISDTTPKKMVLREKQRTLTTDRIPRTTPTRHILAPIPIVRASTDQADLCASRPVDAISRQFAAQALYRSSPISPNRAGATSSGLLAKSVCWAAIAATTHELVSVSKSPQSMKVPGPLPVLL